MNWDDTHTYYKHNGITMSQCDPPHGRGRGDYWDKLVEDALPNPTLIRRATKGMHRADWQPPRRGMLPESIAKAYMEEWGSACANELFRFGIQTHQFGHYAGKNGWKRQFTKGRDEENAVFYTLERN